MIIVIPNTGRILSAAKEKAVKDAAKVILNTLTNHDFFNVVLYSATAQALDPAKTALQRANSANI